MNFQELSLKSLFKTETLSTRQSVSVINFKLQEMLLENDNQKIAIDFSNISQISRSFTDEILKLQKTYSSRGVKINFIKINDFISKMIELVSHKATSIAPVDSVNVATSTILDLKNL